MDIPEEREKDGAPAFQVVVNHEEQYSIWPVGRDVPAGWSGVGVEGDKESCLAHIERVWTDITPLSVRRQLSESAS
ncbi:MULTISPECIES: MbtH family protein [Streptomyces]|nr:MULTISPECIES: MbtH family NRPS accessory protein [Streptomyces]NNG86438.1 MbtH family NRPS accessory protein [Streptomyces cacaoi]QHF98559.1 MbtH family protein [Streptomyces sp. NHF165]